MDFETVYNFGKKVDVLTFEIEHVNIDALEALEKEGVSIPRPPGPMKHGGSVIAFIEDPDGYKIELIEKKIKIDIIDFPIDETRYFMIFINKI